MFFSNLLNKSGLRSGLNFLTQHFVALTVKYHVITSLYGFFLILVFLSQIFSGVMLSFSLVPECMLIPIVRDEEDLEDLYTDDFF